jgi:LPS sulfotransferase NodH
MKIEPFIILGRPRTGSTLLQALLNSHSHLRVFGELFALYNLPGWGIEPALKSPDTIALIQSDPVKFLEQYLFNSLPRRLIASPFKPHLRAVGFKLFYDQAHEAPWQVVWSWAKDRKDLKIIHIKRRNILKSHLSQRRAQVSRSWISTSVGEPAPSLRLYLDYEECLHAFNYTREQETLCDSTFCGHPKIDVIYENLSSDWKEEVDRVQEFLKVPRESLKLGTLKQANLPAKVEIANYLELKERFRGTAWEDFFDD